MNVRRLLALDPATHITGYAVFETCMPTEPHHWLLVRAGNIKAGKTEDWQYRCCVMTSLIGSLLGSTGNIVLEYPEFQGGLRGAFASRGGDTLKLAFLCGMIYQMALSTWKVQTLTPNVWKGQCPKSVTQLRCEKKYRMAISKGVVDDNTVDAVMIGDYWVETIQKEIADRATVVEMKNLP
jgi:hypothetical protein